MRKLLFATSVFPILLMIWTIPNFGQEKKLVENVVVKLSIPKEYLHQEFKFSHNHDFSKTLVGGSFATVDCFNCILSSYFSFYIFQADRIDNQRLKIGLNIEFDKKKRCNVHKELTLSSN